MMINETETWRQEMADQAAKTKRKKTEKPVTQDVIGEGVEGVIGEIGGEVKLPPLEIVDQQCQRKKLEVMRELEDFRASFSRGYAVILTELALKREREGVQTWKPKPSKVEESEQS